MSTAKTRKKNNYVSQNEPVVQQFHELDLSGTYSYANYLKWQFDERLELIRGKIFPMSAPTITHQRILLRLAVVFEQLSRKKECCETFIAPFDVRLPGREKGDAEVFTVVKPDLCVVCDPGQLDEKGCVGRPALIVEVLSPGSLRNDLQIKRELYAEVGVTEYFIIDTKRQFILKHLLDGQHNYVQQVFSKQEICGSTLFPDLALVPDQLFGSIIRQQH